MFFPVIFGGCFRQFTAMTLSQPLEWHKFVYGGSIWVGAGFATGLGGGPYYHALASSSDHINWTEATSGPLASALSGKNITSLAHNGTIFCALLQGASTTYTAPDGTTWTENATGVLPLGDDTHGSGLIAIGGTFYAVVQTDSINYFRSSTNGAAWTQRSLFPSSTGTYRGMASDGTTVVAVNDTGYIVYSTVADSLTSTWSAATGEPVSSYRQVIHNGTAYIAVGDPGEDGAKSLDGGATWSAITLPTNYGGTLITPDGIYGNLAALTNGMIMLPAYYLTGNAAGSYTYFSCDNGENWTLGTLPSSHYWQGSGSDGSIFVGGANDFNGGSTAGYYSS